MNKLNGSLKIAIQKSGRIAPASIELLKGIGLDFEEYTRQLYSICKNYDASILYTRDDDIPEFVSTGSADLGIVGLDEVLESGVNVKTLMKLGFGKCSLCVAVEKNSKIQFAKDLAGKKIATSFPKITKQYFEKLNIDIEVVQLAGGVELAPNIGIADAIVDIVSSGFTLKMNGLKVIEEMMDSEIVLIANKDLDEKKKEQVKKLVFRIESLQNAKNKKYIMLNLPEKKLSMISKVVPGLNSPTVAKLDRPGWISVQTVVEESNFWDVIDKLKQIGAQGIIVMPIEKIII